MIPTLPGSDRLLLAVSFACFAVAGVATAAVDAVVPTLAATAVAVAGVGSLAGYAGRVSRERLARLSMGFWLAFLAVAGVHAVGLEPVGAAVPGSTALAVHSLRALTWATLLSACGATTFLGFREYGAAGTDAPEEQVLEGETSDYSTR